ERLVEVERRGFREAREIDASHHERFEVGARQAAGLQLLDRRRHGIVQLEDLPAAALALLERPPHRPIEELVGAAEDRLIRAAAQARPLLVADPEREKRRLLELEGEGGLRLVARAGER